VELPASDGLLKIAPAVAAGCTSRAQARGADQHSPRSKLADLVQEAGFPAA